MVLGSIFGRFKGSRVTIFADFIDPFCYVGVHNLFQALEASRATFEWHGFELNPDTPEEGFSLETAANSDLRGGMWTSVETYAAHAGLKLREPSRTPNTRRAQTLVAAAPEGVKKSLIDRLYQAYFTDGQDIGQTAVLERIAAACGVPPERTSNALAVPNDFQAHRHEATQLRFPGMPGFLFQGKTYFGALPVHVWKDILTT